MIIVTGGAGFIGSNLVKALNQNGEDDILVVDDLTVGKKFANLASAHIADYVQQDDFRRRLTAGESFGPVKAVFHQGACSDTTEWNGELMLDLNFAASKEVFTWCQSHAVPLIYASSAAVYGAGQHFSEDEENLAPLNIYGWSKLLFDRWVARQRGDLAARVVGFRYFNVYGPGEGHKGRMASVIHHFRKQVADSGTVHLFGASHGCGDGEHRRDFIYVGDVVKANLWALDSDAASGLYNVGTGTARTFNDVARAVIAWHGSGTIEYIPMPDDLTAAYQAFTQAEVDHLRAAGFADAFTPVEDGVKRALDAEAQAVS